MSKPTTHVLLLVDDSASMYRVVESVRSGFNEYIDSLIQDNEVKYRVTVGIFGVEYRAFVVAQKPKDVPKLNGITYRADQLGTALYDALGRLIQEFERKNPNLPENDKVLLVIQTDGQDNASREVDLNAARDLIEARQASGVWNVLFLGAGLSGWNAGSSLGVPTSNLYRTDHTDKGYHASYGGITRSSQATARGASNDEVAEIMRGAVNGDDA